jgi:predicted nuclease of predicted toxin-antitoxin system
MNPRPEVRLLLDEMFSPAIAAELRQLGHDVIAVADRPDLRSKSDPEIFAWASAEKRWLLTENVKDFRPIMLRALPAGSPGCGLLFTSGRVFPRSRKNPGPLIPALDAWLTAGPPAPAVTESWLLGQSGSVRPASGHVSGSRLEGS